MSTNMYQSLAYAEQFGAEKAYAEALGLDVAIKEAETDVAAVGAALRRAKARYEDRKIEIEIEVSSRELEADAKCSQAAIDRKTKFAIAGDEEMKALSASILSIAHDLDLENANLAAVKAAHRTAVARIEGLGGWFHFLAAVKDANTNNEKMLAATPF